MDYQMMEKWAKVVNVWMTDNKDKDKEKEHEEDGDGTNKSLQPLISEKEALKEQIIVL